MNQLASETSPYLLQHKTNPVDWHPWSTEAFEKAESKNLLVLVSIGYSACHWCHVMEHESFEDQEIASYMNEHFVNIKVDREERPDVDQVYMSAVQLMTQRGGWPLNCFVLPNGKPFYGGTYYPKDQRLNILKQLVHVQKNEPEKLIEYADKLAEGVANSEFIELLEQEEFSVEVLVESTNKWANQFDWKLGGMNRAPKFPMPTNYQFLQELGVHTSDQQILDLVDLTLEKMARGGIFDQLAGGFCRYSVDAFWKVPHFEKMLYDNGQLLSLYAFAYARTGSKEYKAIIDLTVDFLRNELHHENGGFYSALDADSEGVEGKFYVWKSEELKEVLGEDYQFAVDYYQINEVGYWEEGNYVLMRSYWEDSEQLQRINSKLLTTRSSRIRPGLDDKIITSWNALTISGLVDAYMTTDQESYLELAVDCGRFISKQLLAPNGKLFHTFQKGESKIDGFLEDYAFTCSAFIRLFEATSEEAYIHQANLVLQYAIENFFNDSNGMFNFTDKDGEQLIAIKQEISDNVIPASNSELAHVLHQLGNYFGNSSYIQISKQMLSNIWKLIPNYPSGYSNWASLGLNMCNDHIEVVISGHESDEILKKMKSLLPPSAVILKCSQESELPIFKGRFQLDETSIFVCRNGACQAPVSSIQEALKLAE
ncbi:MAG: thioredoxin domain-containing protein [Flavobacteriales bacterium]|nr:thioredoxin domain-containing protein [Flavobacteriales bacterium]